MDDYLDEEDLLDEDDAREKIGKMTEEDLYHYNINRLRTHDQASKQYSAITKGIDNIKNKNKIKINLT